FVERKSEGSALEDDRLDLLLQLPVLNLPYRLLIAPGDEGAFARYRYDQPFLLQFVIGPLGRDHADLQRLRQAADRRQQLSCVERPGHDLLFHLFLDLPVDRLPRRHRYREIHRFTALSVHIVYIQDGLENKRQLARRHKKKQLFLQDGAVYSRNIKKSPKAA